MPTNTAGIVAGRVVFGPAVAPMSVSGFTPPRADLTPPSTETSSGSVRTKEPAAQRVKLDSAAAASGSVPYVSSAGLVVTYRQKSREEAEDAGCGGSGVPAYPAPGAATKDDDSEKELVGSSSSDASFQPRSREATLQGPDLKDFQR